MNYADIKKIDIANGEGVRVSLFVSGCNHHCKGCFNQCAWDFDYGDKFTEKDTKIYAREVIRLRLSLESAKNLGYSKIIVMIHYPPFNEGDDESEFMKIFKEYNVEKVIYGHLHGPGRFKAKTGLINDIEYIMTSCDFIDFDPVKIL